MLAQWDERNDGCATPWGVGHCKEVGKRSLLAPQLDIELLELESNRTPHSHSHSHTPNLSFILYASVYTRIAYYSL